MRAHGIEMPAPGFDDDLSFLQRIEDLPVQELIAQSGIEGFGLSTAWNVEL